MGKIELFHKNKAIPAGSGFLTKENFTYKRHSLPFKRESATSK